MLTFKTLTAAVCLSTAFLVMSGCDLGSSEHQSADKHMQRSAAYLEQGQFKAALIEARNAIQQEPGSANGHLLMAEVLMEMGQYKRALEELANIKDTPSTDYLLTQATLFNKLKKFRSADKLLTQHQEELQREATRAYLKQAGLAKLGLNDPAAAKKLFTQLQQQEPDSPEANTLLAQIAAAQGDIEQAQQLIDRALSANGTHTEALLLRAAIHFRNKQLPAAEDALTQALTGLESTDIMTPIRANLLRNLAQTLTLQGRSSEALVYIRLLADAFPGHEIAADGLEKAIASYQEKDLDATRQQLESLLKEYPNYEQAKQLLAVVNYLQGDLEAANNYFKDNLDPETASSQLNEVAALTGLQLNQHLQVMSMLEDEIQTTDNPNILALYGLAALNSNAPAKSEQAFLKAIELDARPQYRLLLANLYNRQTPPAPDKALDQLQQAYQRDDKAPEILSALVGQYLDFKQVDEAKKLVERALSSQPDNASIQQLAGKFYLTQNQFSQAKGAFNRASKLVPKAAEPLLYLAQINTLEQDYTEASRLFKQVIALAPDNPIAYRGLLALNDRSAQQGQHTSADKLFSDLAAADKTGNTTTQQLVLAEYHLRNKELDKAKEITSKLTETSADDIRVKNLNGLIALQAAAAAFNGQQYEEARLNSLEGLQFLPEHPPLLILLAKSEIALGNSAEAQKITEQIAVMSPAASLELKGDLAANASPANSTAAASFYQQAWQKSPSDQLGQKLYYAQIQQEPADAKNFLQNWLKMAPNSLTANTIKTSNLIEQKDYLKAIPELEKLLAKNPKQPIYLNNLAWSYLQVDNIKQALSNAEKAYTLAPALAPVVDTYGWILFKADKKSEALDILKQALALDPNNPEIKSHYQTIQNNL